MVSIEQSTDGVHFQRSIIGDGWLQPDQQAYFVRYLQADTQYWFRVRSLSYNGDPSDPVTTTLTTPAAVDETDPGFSIDFNAFGADATRPLPHVGFAFVLDERIAIA